MSGCRGYRILQKNMKKLLVIKKEAFFENTFSGPENNENFQILSKKIQPKLSDFRVCRRCKENALSL